MSGPANQLLRQLGLLLFLAEVGTSAGKNLVATFQESGLLLFGVGAAITVVPMLVAVVVGRLVFKISLLDLLGTITGGMTSTPGLAAADSMVDSNIPSVAYATVYPIAMVFLILFIQVIASAVIDISNSRVGMCKGSKYFWHIFYLDECCIFIYRYEEKKIFILFLL